MKKILLATTMLVGTAGFAAAEVAFSGSAAMGVGRDGDNKVENVYNNGEFHLYNSAKLVVTMSGETDTGLSFGASFDVSVGRGYAFADDEGFEDKSGAFGAPEVFIEGAFGKLSLDLNDYDSIVNETEGGDAKYVYTAGPATATVIYDAEPSDYSVGLGYASDVYSVGLAYDSFDGAANLTGSYTIGAVTVSATAENTEAGGVNSVKVAYAQDGISGSLEVGDDSTWEVAGGYAANGVTLGASLDDGDAWELTGSYDLGGGASVVGGTNSVDDLYAGVAFSF